MLPRFLIITAQPLQIEPLLTPFADRGVELIFASDPAYGVELFEKGGYALTLYDASVSLPNPKESVYQLTQPLDSHAIKQACEEALKGLDISPMPPM